MPRDLAALSETTFDVLVIGGGVVGACAAWDATLRGLRVALVERGDFACGASWNSLKTLHGGLRSLQHLDFAGMRAYGGDRSAWARIAPHLVDLLPVVMPTSGFAARSRAVLRTALAVNDLVGFDRNRGLSPELRFPAGRALSRDECVAHVPEFADTRMTGGVLWYDAQMYSAERLVLEMILGARDAGAVVANYVEATGPLICQRRIAGAICCDTLGGDRVEIRAHTIVNAAGSASTMLAERFLGGPARARTRYTAALNVMLPSLGHRAAFALPSRLDDHVHEGETSNSGNLFIVPWRGRTVIGTGYFPYDGDPSVFALRESDVERFLDDVNRAWPVAPIARDAIVLVHGGLLPLAAGARDGEPARALERRQGIVDHASHGAPEMLSAVSVRFTTARGLAERLVDLVERKLGRRGARCRTATTPVPGAPSVPVPDLLADARRRHGAVVDADVLEHLVRSYGARYERVLAYRDRLPGWNERIVPECPVIRAQLVYGVHEEMAQRPEDLLQRRTEIGPRGAESSAARREAERAFASQSLG
ncbi:MAG TPA: FAD-dependent oxidoreductase [Gemmatimonadaceae bacterium]